MEYKEILNYAIKGLGIELEKIDKSLRKGRRLIEQYNRGETLKTDLTIYEMNSDDIYEIDTLEDLIKIDSSYKRYIGGDKNEIKKS